LPNASTSAANRARNSQRGVSEKEQARTNAEPRAMYLMMIDGTVVICAQLIERRDSNRVPKVLLTIWSKMSHMETE